VKSKMPTEQERAEKILEVAEKVGETQILFVASDNNFGGANPPFEKQPFTEVTPEIVEAMQAFAPKQPPG